MSDCTCYIGHPDDPNADEEGCAACEAEFWQWAMGVLILQQTDGDQ